MRHPVGATENALIDAVLYPGGRRSRSTPRGRSYAAAAASGLTASQFRALEGASAHDRLAALMAVQRDRFAPVARPVLPDPAPVAWRPFFDGEWARRKHEARLWQRTRRRDLRAEITRHAEAHADQLLSEAMAVHTAEQQRADNWWEALNAGDAQTVTAALSAAFADNQAAVTVASAAGGRCWLLLHLPGPDVLPDRKRYFTPTGRASSKPWTKTEHNEVYAELLGAHLLATVREAWAVAPSVDSVRVVGLSPERTVLFDLTCERGQGEWDDDRAGSWVLADEPGGLHRTGRTREVTAWPPEELSADVTARIAGPERDLRAPPAV